MNTELIGCHSWNFFPILTYWFVSILENLFSFSIYRAQAYLKTKTFFPFSTYWLGVIRKTFLFFPTDWFVSIFRFLFPFSIHWARKNKCQFVSYKTKITIHFLVLNKLRADLIILFSGPGPRNSYFSVEISKISIKFCHFFRKVR